MRARTPDIYIYIYFPRILGESTAVTILKQQLIKLRGDWECLTYSDWKCLTYSNWTCLTYSVVPKLRLLYDFAMMTCVLMGSWTTTSKVQH
jgi:hypothetical protein